MTAVRIAKDDAFLGQLPERALIDIATGKLFGDLLRDEGLNRRVQEVREAAFARLGDEGLAAFALKSNTMPSFARGQNLAEQGVSRISREDLLIGVARDHSASYRIRRLAVLNPHLIDQDNILSIALDDPYIEVRGSAFERVLTREGLSRIVANESSKLGEKAPNELITHYP